MMQGPTPLPTPPGLDPNLLVDQLVPLIGVLAVLIVGAMALRWLFRSPIGEAIAEGIRLTSQNGLRWSAYGTNMRFLEYLIHYTMGDWQRARELAADFPIRVGTPQEAVVSAYIQEIARPPVAEQPKSESVSLPVFEPPGHPLDYVTLGG